jgi:hypothetical protein
MVAILGTIGTFLAGASAVVGVQAQINANNATDKANKAESKRIADSRAVALEKRKSLIDTQRQQTGIGVDGYDTMRTSESGINGDLQSLIGGEVLG